jgi:hemolysin activation/secretion protein
VEYWKTAAGRGRACLALFFAAFAAHAQQVPDAGQLLRQQPAPPVPSPAPARVPGPAAPVTGDVLKGPRFLIKEFRFTGAALVPEADLQERVAGYRGERVTFGVLQLVAEQLSGYYLERGYFARVVVPPQEIKDGVVRMQVIEGRRGALVMDNKGRRVDPGRVAAFIDRRLAEGAPLATGPLDEAMTILNEQPGVVATTALRPGAREGQVDLVVSTNDRPLVTGAAGLNNYGTPASGRAQVQGLVALNNPTGHFDGGSLLFNASQGNTYLRGDYNVALGDRGLRVGANASYLDYEIVDSSLRPLQLNGNATTYGLTASYPLSRTRALGLDLVGGYDVKQLIDRNILGEASNREVRVTTFGVFGNVNHATGSLASVTNFGANVSAGTSDQRNAAALAVDNVTRQVNGGYSKLGYTASHVQELDPQWRASVAMRGQFASQNLDSVERIALGGPTGVRARRSFGADFAGTLFYDVGGVTLNKTPWAAWNAGNPKLPNRYTLSGIGAGLDWRVTRASLVSAMVAFPLGNNPGSDVNNRNSDGSTNEARFWLSLNAQF